MDFHSVELGSTPSGATNLCSISLVAKPLTFNQQSGIRFPDGTPIKNKVMNNTIDNRNIIDKYKTDLFTKWTTEMIKSDLQSKSFPYSVLMEHFVGDFTIGSVLRSGNAFGVNKMYYYGGKKSFDKRSTVGTHLYTDMIHLTDIDELLKLKEEFVFVGLENSVEKSESIYNFSWPINSLIILGEEGIGITKETLKLCDKIVYIPQYGSVRSINASSAASIAMNDYVSKYKI